MPILVGSDVAFVVCGGIDFMRVPSSRAMANALFPVLLMQTSTTPSPMGMVANRVPVLRSMTYRSKTRSSFSPPTPARRMLLSSFDSNIVRGPTTPSNGSISSPEDKSMRAMSYVCTSRRVFRFADFWVMQTGGRLAPGRVQHAGCTCSVYSRHRKVEWRKSSIPISYADYQNFANWK